VAISMVIGCANAFKSGATASIDLSVLKEAKDVYFDKVLDIMNHFQVPDIELDNGYIHKNSFKITQKS